MYFLEIFLPLFASFVVGFFGRFLGNRGVVIFNLFVIFLSFLISLFIFFEVVLCGQVCFLFLNN
jgi:NADH:ubiquinone oxidoreductase subunit 5 (subunit L)/multisubunit Na+/H+ antiporter MnhA subunit